MAATCFVSQIQMDKWTSVASTRMHTDGFRYNQMD
ncbi:unnamed protein product [Toxocara canis]|uniref:Uncharacterized protein n=1 Tax=Toxocara canis TaxID=6265 RepID=A0A183UY80_TOXCA|nr:unnamed protein product [Toxocara canis]